MSSIKELLANNAAWAASCLKQDPNYFQKLSKVQQPHFLWVGCSDARVPANTIVGLQPGEVFVHRNIANQVIDSDLNCLSVIQFAVEYLKVKEIIVCGHYGCGGVQGVLAGQPMGLIDDWLLHIKDLYLRHRDELDAIRNDEQRARRLCELNVAQQVLNVCQTSFVREAWKAGRDLKVDGLIYDIHDGLLRNLNIGISGKED